MGIDTLAEITAAARAELADTGTVFSAAIMNQAVYEVVADISRLAPREMFAVITLDNLEVEDAAVTSDESAWVSIVASTATPLDRSNPPVVTNAAGTTTYTEFTDYIIDYVLGRLYTLASGSIGDGTSLLVDYHKSRVAFGLSALTDIIRIDRVMWLRSGKIQEFDTFQKWGSVCWLTTKDRLTQANFLENDQFYVWYYAEHTVPGASAGSYPAYMADVVVKGTVAYALFAKHRERNLQAVTDVATSRTALGLALYDAVPIQAAIAAATTALTSMSTVLGTVDAEADALVAAITTALGKVTTHAETEADAALDIVATRMGEAVTALNLINAELLLANTALDNLTTDLPVSGDYYNEAIGRVQHTVGLVQEAEARLTAAQVQVAEGNARTEMGNTFVAEGQQRIAKLLSLVQVALAYAEEATRRLDAANHYMALGNLFLDQADGYMAGADREIQVADRLLVDARERHADYWTHLQSRVESAKGGARADTRQLPV